MAQIAFDNSYARLEGPFFARVRPTAAVAPKLLELNRPLALQLGFDPEDLATPAGVDVLSGRRLPEGGGPHRNRLCGAPVRGLRAATRGRPARSCSAR